jgi:hypothetical protein
MLRQLGRLQRAVPAAGPEVFALAVYAEPLVADETRPSVNRPAQEQGFEGVACVDDAARAIVVYCLLWRRWRVASARVAAYRLLRFLAYMQTEDGRFVNFIFDWTGRRNCAGSSSYPGGPQWQARAVHALACAVVSFGEPEWDERFRRGLAWLDAATPYLDVRAVGVLAVLEHWRATGDRASAERALAWCSEIASHADHDRLPDAVGVASIHLWGHLQEAALADTGRELVKPDLIERARASAEMLLLPVVEGAFDLPRVLPFDVSCAVAGLAAVGVATGDRRYTAAATLGRLWFLGRNNARQTVYDGRLGLVYDGIDAGRVSRNSGAESNIEGALALYASVQG